MACFTRDDDVFIYAPQTVPGFDMNILIQGLLPPKLLNKDFITVSICSNCDIITGTQSLEAVLLISLTHT